MVSSILLYTSSHTRRGKVQEHGNVARKRLGKGKTRWGIAVEGERMKKRWERGDLITNKVLKTTYPWHAQEWRRRWGGTSAECWAAEWTGREGLGKMRGALGDGGRWEHRYQPSLLVRSKNPIIASNVLKSARYANLGNTRFYEMPIPVNPFQSSLSLIPLCPGFCNLEFLSFTFWISSFPFLGILIYGTFSFVPSHGNLLEAFE